MNAARVLRFILAIGLAGTPALAQSTGGFPHARHAGVFPVCEGCHTGIVSGDSAKVFPTREDCARCHDGTRRQPIAWQAPTPRQSNLRFSHAVHRREAAGDSLNCLTCHATTDPPRRMVVAGPDPNRCVRCHAHRGDVHIAPTASCRTCHVPLTTASRLTTERIGRFPRPAWHETAGFDSTHGRTASTAQSCAICHARESCERCHANADQIPLIANLSQDTRVAALVAGKSARYAAPSSHRRHDWRDAHGASAARADAGCANCHTQPSCLACHAGGAGSSQRVIAALPGPASRKGLGVPVERIDRAVHGLDVIKRHGALAASARMDCTQCHSETTCASCHAASDSRRFHAANFVERHAVEVFSNGADCQSCHNSERFCRDCHARNGIAAEARMTAAFHTGKANWVLSHGQAARTGMESCVSCHKQNDCIRCHSASGGWGVNPHRAGFDASRLAERNSTSCRMCHIGRLPGGGP